MSLCPKEKCRWYDDETKYGRKCYYEAQCWKGKADILFLLIMEKIKK